MTGMVKQDNKCEMIAIPAATVVSLPYALGITIVFNPRGMDTEQMAQMIAVSEGLKIYKANIVTAGNTIKRTKVIT